MAALDQLLMFLCHIVTFLLSSIKSRAKSTDFLSLFGEKLGRIVLQLKPIPKFIHFNHRIQGQKVDKVDGSKGV